MVVILFVCTGNAARSQMAEGLLRNQKPEFTVLSAGTKPEGVSKKAIKVMEELNLDISNHTSNHLDEVDWKSADFAITLCGSANETCVTMNWPEKCKREHWPIDDPNTDDEYINARDEIKGRVKDFVNRLI